MTRPLIIFGESNILSDLFDAALACGLGIGKVVRDHAGIPHERDRPLQDRLAALAALGQSPLVQDLADFQPADGELYLLGPTTPERADLAQRLGARWQLPFHTLVHPTAYVSPLATLGQGVFVGANSVIAPGAVLADHVFVNRGVTIGHDTVIGAFSRIQPGSNVGGLSRLGSGVTVAIGASLVERLHIGDHAFVGAGAVVTADVAAHTLVVGVPARFKKSLLPGA